MRHPFRRVSLSTKLVAAALVLVTAALVVIGVVSAVRVRQFQLGRIDQDLLAGARGVNLFVAREGPADVYPAPGFYSRLTTPAGVGLPGRYDHDQFTAEDVPPLTTGLANIQKVEGRPFTVTAPSGMKWRMLVAVLDNGEILYFAESLSGLDETMGKFVVTELLVGGCVVVLLGIVAAGMVRVGLRPLVQIERTADAIARGDLTQRVPDMEPGVEDPQTEMGRLGRSLNTMLGQIEAAFTARENSEAAALQAEAVARNAADQAHISELRARRSEEKMRQFVADASHELRTPLTTIRGFAELYRQGAARAPEQVENLAKRIEDEAARMGLLVEDLLLLARLDEERPLVRSPVELRVLAVDAVSAARAVAPDRKVTLEVAEGAGALNVLADESRLRQVIGNLMTNALTHTPAGTPVRLRLNSVGDNAVLEVIDAGPGLTGEQAERVFERFYRVDSARTRRVDRGAGVASGAGLGLAIVAALVAAHGGRVEVESTPGDGATFRVILPREVTDEMADSSAYTHS
jgi:two-component system OmpR family sensor kinase